MGFRLLVIFLNVVLYSSCSPQTAQNKSVIVQFKNEINGYKVRSLWLPAKLHNNHIIGPAIIQFNSTQGKESFTISTNNFSLLKSRVKHSYNESNQSVKVKTNEILLEYYPQKFENNESFGTTEEPFFFQDVTFDGEKELIIAEVGNGQRECSTFKVYNFFLGDLTPELYQITYIEPFKSLDQYSNIDYRNKQITIYNSNGSCASSYFIYTQKKSSEEYMPSTIELEYIIEEEYIEESDECYKNHYKAIGPSKKLLSKKRSD